MALAICVGVLDSEGNRVDTARADGTYVPFFLQLEDGLTYEVEQNGETNTISVSAPQAPGHLFAAGRVHIQGIPFPGEGAEAVLIGNHPNIASVTRVGGGGGNGGVYALVFTSAAPDGNYSVVCQPRVADSASVPNWVFTATPSNETTAGFTVTTQTAEVTSAPAWAEQFAPIDVDFCFQVYSY